MKNGSMFLVSQGFSLFGLEIKWYGLIMAFAMVCGLLNAFWICKIKNYNKNMPIDLVIAAIPCALVGARLYYCIFHGVNSFVEIFEVWKGGMAIYGGVIGGFLGICLCCLIKKYPLAQACDVAAPCLILGQCIGRIGCYFAGCCYGIEVVNQAHQWFPFSVQIDGVWHYSTFFFESFFNLIGYIVLMIVMKKTKPYGITTASYLMFYGVVRSILEGFRGDSLYLFNTGIRVSQALSIVLVAVGLALLITIIVLDRKKKKAGDKSNE